MNHVLRQGALVVQLDQQVAGFDIDRPATFFRDRRKLGP